MCKAYGGEPSVDLLRAFLNLGPAGNWLTLSNRGGSSVPRALTKPIIHIEGCKGNFFFIENKIVPSEYPELLLEENKLDKKSFKDVIPTHARDDPLYNQIATYPCNVRTFPDPILYLAGLKTSWKHSPKKPIIYYRRREIDFRSFMMEGIYGEFHFLPEEEFVENIGNSDDASSEKDEVTLIHRTIAEKAQNRKVSPSSKVTGKRKQTADDPNIHEFPSAKELKESIDSVLDNMLNGRTRKLMSTLLKARASCDAIQEREIEKDKAYVKLERKCNDALHDLDKNPLVLDMRAEIETLQGQVDRLHGEYSRLVLEENKWINYEQTLAILRSKVEGLESERKKLKSSEIQLLQEIDGMRQDRATVVAKVFPHMAIELVRSDEMGFLVSRLVKAAMF
ncbi:hypothetical protein Tco_1342148, partial [Tanacetum coccineum]